MSSPKKTYKYVTLTISNGVALLALNRPQTLNAMSPVMIRELQLALDQVEPSPEVRCLVLTGTGRAFCSGADLRPGESGAENQGRHDSGYDLEFHYHPLLRRIRRLEMPFLTAVNGPAVGVGVSLALMGDLIFCARSSYFLHSFQRVGLVPDGGSTWLLPRLVRRARALELSLLGERMTAETALHWGMVNKVYDNDRLIAEVCKAAEQLAHGPTVALGLTRRLYWESASRSYEDQIDLERSFQRRAGETDDSCEGIKAFAEKRKPRFTGR